MKAGGRNPQTPLGEVICWVTENGQRRGQARLAAGGRGTRRGAGEPRAGPVGSAFTADLFPADDARGAAQGGRPMREAAGEPEHPPAFHLSVVSFIMDSFLSEQGVLLKIINMSKIS